MGWTNSKYCPRATKVRNVKFRRSNNMGLTRWKRPCGSLTFKNGINETSAIIFEIPKDKWIRQRISKKGIIIF